MKPTFAQPKGAGYMAMWSAREKQMRQDSSDVDRNIVTFGDALKRVRISMGWSHRTLAHAIGRSVDDIKDMEGGRMYPRGRDKPRLMGVMEGIRPFMKLIPKKPEDDTDQPIEIIAEPNPAAEDVTNTYTLPEEVPINFGTFGSALKGLRIREGLEHDDVANLCATKAEDISSIEDGTLPIDARVFQQLIILFDDLKRAPEPPLMHLQLVPDPKDTIPTVAQLDDPTIRWAAATKKAAVATKKVARLEAELKAAREALESATLERDLAQQEVEQAALEEAGE